MNILGLKRQKTLAPKADAVYNISITKNGERNTLFAVGSQGVLGPIEWRDDFDNMILHYTSTPQVTTCEFDSPDCDVQPNTRLDSRGFAAVIWSFIRFCGARCGYSVKLLSDLHISAHSLHGSFAAYGEAMEWHYVPVHKLGRWRIPSSKAAIVPVRQRRGAGRAGATSISAVYSTAASCQTQLELRCRMISAIRCIGTEFTTEGDLSCFTSNAPLVEAGFRGPHGHEATASSEPLRLK